MLANLFTADLMEGLSQPAGYEDDVSVDISRALYNTANLTNMLANRTESVTVSTQSVDRTDLCGEAWRSEAFVKIHWPCCLLPQCFWRMSHQRCEGRRLCHCCCTTTLIAKIFWAGMTANDMEKRPKSLQVRLGRSQSEGWKFVLSRAASWILCGCSARLLFDHGWNGLWHWLLRQCLLCWLRGHGIFLRPEIDTTNRNNKGGSCSLARGIQVGTGALTMPWCSFGNA